MRVHVTINGARHEAAVPYEGADHVCLALACPACDHASPLKLRGRGIERHGHDFEAATAVALCCGQVVGKIVVTYSTIFGIEEDRAVLNGRPRVY